MLIYPITLTQDSNNTLLVAFPDIPEANSVGDNEKDALRNAAEALQVALKLYFDSRRPVPLPSLSSAGEHVISLPALSTAKVLLWNEMHEQKLRKADLARMLGVFNPQVDRLFDLSHSSKIEFVEQAANALGKSLNISLN